MARTKKRFLKAAGQLFCLKRKYGTRKQARTALKSARCNGLKEVYKCPACESWHLTSQRLSERENRGIEQ